MRKVGIILAGGRSSRLYPTTLGVTKQLLPIYDKPLIYYPLSTLMLAKIQEVLIITAPSELDIFQRLFHNHNLGINLNFTTQSEPKGIAEALLIAEFFYGQRADRTCLILGDNFFYGAGLSQQLWKAVAAKDKAVVFASKVRDPERFGVVEMKPFDNYFHQATSIEEKPKKPKSNYAATGLYFYPSSAYEYASKLEPSPRGELEITDLNKMYLDQNNLFVNKLQRGSAWFDTGTANSMIEASHFVQTVQHQQDILVGSPQEIGYNNGWMKKEDVMHFANKCKNDYGKYLKEMINHGHK